MEIEVLIDYIKKARIKGFRDDFIKKGLLNKGFPEDVIDEAFSNAGNPKRAELRTRMGKEDKSKTPITVIIDDWLKYAIEKKAKKDGLSLRSEMKKILVKNTPSDYIDRKVKRKTFIYKKRREEQKEMHNIGNRKYRERVEKERKKVGKSLKIEGLPDFDEGDE